MTLVLPGAPLSSSGRTCELTRVGTLINVTPEDRFLGSGRPVKSLRPPTTRAAMIYMRASPARRPGAIPSSR